MSIGTSLFQNTNMNQCKNSCIQGDNGLSVFYMCITTKIPISCEGECVLRPKISYGEKESLINLFVYVCYSNSVIFMNSFIYTVLISIYFSRC